MLVAKKHYKNGVARMRCVILLIFWKYLFLVRIMTVYLARTYVVEASKLDAHNEWGKKLVALMKKKPSLFRGVKSLKVLRHKSGGSEGKFTALWGFKSSADIEGWENGFTEIPDEKALRKEFMDLIVPGSFSACILEPVKTLKRKTKRSRKK